MDRLQSMRWFLKVVETGSFTLAAKTLGTNTGLVSRTVSDLEARLRTRLLNRTTRRTVVTEAGRQYVARCLEILAMIEEAEAEARGAHSSPAGRLRLHAYSGIGHHYVIPSIASYQERYTDVTVDLTLSPSSADLFEGGFDATVVVAQRLPESVLVREQIGETASILCAAPSFLARYRPIREPADLEHLPCAELINPSIPTGRWTLHREGSFEAITLPIAGHFRTNIAESMASALERGMGVGALPVCSALKGLQDGSLLRVLPEYILHPMGVFVVYASARYLDAKIRTWVDHFNVNLRDQLSAERALLDRAA